MTRTKRTLLRRGLIVLCTMLLLGSIFLLGSLAAGDGFASVSLTLGENINITFNANVSDEANTKVIFNYKEGTSTVQAADAQKNTDGTYGFVFRGIAPHSLCDVVRADLYVGETLVQSKAYSVKAYCDSLAGSSNETLLALVDALLYYGKAAEEYTAKEGNTLTDVTIDAAKLPSSMVVTTDKSLDLLDGATVKIVSSGLLLSNRITTYFDFQVKDGQSVADPHAAVTVGATTRAATVTELSDGKWRVSVDMKPTELYSPITAVMLDGATPVSGTAHYSVAAYLSAKTGDASLSQLVKCIYLYGYSAHSYVGHTDHTLSTEMGTCAGVGHRTDRCEICMTETVIELPAQSLVHKEIATTVTNGILHYSCTDCGYTWAATDAVFVNNGADKTGLLVNKAYTNTNGAFSYQHSGTNQQQMELWISKFSTCLDINASNYAGAVLSVRVTANGKVPNSNNANSDFEMQLVEDNNGESRWGAKWNYKTPVFKIENGVMYGWNSCVLGAFSEDNASIDLSIAFSFNRKNNTITAVYYINGQGVTSTSVSCTTVYGGFNSVYFNGYTATDGSGIILDNLTLAYTTGRKTGITVEPTCGSVTYYEDGQPKEIDNHSFDDQILVDATCTAEGKMTRTCQLCGDVRTVSIPRTAHSINPTLVFATQSLPNGVSHSGSHKTTGVLEYQCTECGGYFGFAANSLRDFSTAGCACGDCSLPLKDKSKDGNPSATVANGVLTITGPITSAYTTNNCDVTVSPKNHCGVALTDTTRLIVGFDIKGTVYTKGLSMNLKLVGSSNQWVNGLISVAANGTVSFGGTSSGVKINGAEGAMTNVAVAMDITDGILTYHAYLNGRHILTKTVTVTNGVTDFVTSSSYFNLTINPNDANTSGTVILDNLFITDGLTTDPTSGIYTQHKHVYTEPTEVFEANCAHDYQAVYTCACGETETVVNEGTKLASHTFSYQGETVTTGGVTQVVYTCSVCGQRHSVDVLASKSMDNASTGITPTGLGGAGTTSATAMSASYITMNGNTFLAVTGHNASGSNMDVCIRPTSLASLPQNTTEYALSLDLSMPSYLLPEVGFALNLKLGNDWTSGSVISADRSGNLSVNGTAIGKTLAATTEGNENFTNVVVRLYGFDPGTESTKASIKCDVLIDGEQVGTFTKTCGAAGARTFINANTYFNLTVRNSADLSSMAGAEVTRAQNAGVYIDNVAVLPAGSVSDGAVNMTPPACEYELVRRVEPNCLQTGYEVYTCSSCLQSYTVELPITTHRTLQVPNSLAGQHLTFACADCGDSWTSDAAKLADGTSTDALTAADSNQYFSTTKKPAMVNGYYQLVRNEKAFGSVTSGNSTVAPQPQFYLSSVMNNGAALYRNGVVSLKLIGAQTPISHNEWTLQLIDSSSPTWDGGQKGIKLLSSKKVDGVINGNAVYDQAGNHLVTLAAGEEKTFTVLFLAGTGRSEIELHYYVNGTLVSNCTVANTFYSGTPNSLYLSAPSAGSAEKDYAQGEGIYFDDMLLAVSDGDAILTHQHRLYYSEKLSSTTHAGHSGTHVGATGKVVYACYGCEETFTYEAKSFSDFNDGCSCRVQASINVRNRNDNTVEIDYFEYNLAIRGPVSPTYLASGNGDVRVDPKGLLSNDKKMFLSFDVSSPAGGISESGVNVNLKVQNWPIPTPNGDGSTTSYGTSLISIDRDGYVLLQGTRIALLTPHEYTNIGIEIVLNERTTGENSGFAGYHVYVNGMHAGSGSLVVFGTTFNDPGNNSYVTLQVPSSNANVDENRGIIYDNIVIADARPENMIR